ncbi:MAG TPA: hypothetical protein VMH77_07690 [Steroidobacteraceae bacterium]|nr:hypothetical protein [Steroidobacteraceae bacterium]
MKTAVVMPQAANPVASTKPVVSSFTVKVLPLQLDTSDPAVESKVQDYFHALLDELRLVPGLVLIGPDAMSAADTQADFRIAVSGGGPGGSEFMEGVAGWQVTLRTEVWRDHAYRQEARGTMGSLHMGTGTCPQGPGQPDKCGPDGAAATDVAALIKLFPASPALDALREHNREQAELQARDIVTLPPVDLTQRQGAVPPLDDQVVHSILERIAAVPAPGPRAALWLALRGQKYPERLPLLLKALREETADVVRKEIITQLALDFSDDPAVRTALAPVAAVEPQALPRHVAQRALSGDAPWRDYVLATFRDASLTASQRLDPLAWMVDAGQRYPGVDATLNDVLPAMLDGDGARVLVDLLASKQKDQKGSDPMAGLDGIVLMARLSTVDQAAVPDLLVAYFDAMPSEVALGLLVQHHADPRVREKLEAIAAGNADPKLRQLAAAYLQVPSAGNDRKPTEMPSVANPP